MSIISKDGFFFFESFNKPLSLILDKRIDKIIEYINVNKIKSLTIQPNLHDVLPKEKCQNYILTDITETDFLEHIPNIIEIAFLEINNCNLSGLYHLKKLRSLTIANAVNNPSTNLRVDFSKFDKLEELYIDWFDRNFDISHNQKLSTVSIHKYCPQSFDFSELRLPKNIRNIEIVQSNIHNFNGLKGNFIERLELYYCNKLESLKGIRYISDKMRRLMIENAKHLTEYEEIIYCKNLESVVLVNCGNIDTLSWVKYLEKINHFVLEKTTVNDGNMNYLLSIDKVAYTNKKHYNCKCYRSKRDDWSYSISPICESSKDS